MIKKCFETYTLICQNLFKNEEPANLLHTLKSTGKLIFCPEILALIGIPQPISHHPEGDVFLHTLLTINIAAKLKSALHTDTEKNTLMLAALLHDVGKPFSTAFNQKLRRLSGNKHNMTGLQPATQFLNKAGLSSYSPTVLNLIKAHSTPLPVFQYRSEASVLSAITDEQKAAWALLSLLRAADAMGRTNGTIEKIPEDVLWFQSTFNRKMNFCSLF